MESGRRIRAWLTLKMIPRLLHRERRRHFGTTPLHLLVKRADLGTASDIPNIP